MNNNQLEKLRIHFSNVYSSLEDIRVFFKLSNIDTYLNLMRINVFEHSNELCAVIDFSPTCAFFARKAFNDKKYSICVNTLEGLCMEEIEEENIKSTLLKNVFSNYLYEKSKA